MKILHLIPRLQRRGAEVFAAQLFTALSTDGVGGRLAVLFDGNDELGFDGNPNISRLKAGNGLTAVSRLRSLIGEYAPDIVMAYGGQPLKFAALARGTARTPYLVYRKIGLSRDWLGKGRFIKLPFYRRLMSRADFISCVGEESRAEAIELFRVGPGKVRVIYRGVAASPFTREDETKASIRQSLNLPGDAAILISVGALSWEKNLEMLIDVTASLCEEGRAAVLLLAGQGALEKDLQLLARNKGVENHIRFLGVRNDIPRLLKASDVVLLSSLTEGVPGALIEAGLAGVPAVAWDVGGVREVILSGKTGIITPYKDRTSFLNAVRNMIADESLRMQLGKSARDFCIRRFDINHCVKEHVRLFTELLSRSGKTWASGSPARSR